MQHPRICELLAKPSLSRPENRELAVLSIFPQSKQARGAVLLTSLLLGEPLSSSEEAELWQVLSGTSRIEELEEKAERTGDEESELRALLSNSSHSVLRGARKMPLALHVAMAESQALWLQYPEIGLCHMEPALAEYEAMIRVFSALGEDTDYDTRAKIRILDFNQLESPARSFRRGRSGITAEETATLLAELAREPGRVCLSTADFTPRLVAHIQAGKSWYLRRYADRLLTFIKIDLEGFRRSKLVHLLKASFIPDFKEHCQRVRNTYLQDLERYFRGELTAPTDLMNKIENGIGVKLTRAHLSQLLLPPVASPNQTALLLERLAEQCARHVTSLSSASQLLFLSPRTSPATGERSLA